MCFNFLSALCLHLATVLKPLSNMSLPNEKKITEKLITSYPLSDEQNFGKKL